MPRAMIDHIESEKVLPTSDLPKAQDVTSLGVIEENISFPQGYSTQSLAKELAKQLYRNVMQQGMHPGHSAVVFHSDTENEIFPPEEGGLSEFVQLVNDSLRAIPAKRHANHMLQTSPVIKETLLYDGTSFGDPSAYSVPLLAESTNKIFLCTFHYNSFFCIFETQKCILSKIEPFRTLYANGSDRSTRQFKLN